MCSFAGLDSRFPGSHDDIGNSKMPFHDWESVE
jgi:hypothetical protein